MRKLLSLLTLLLSFLLLNIGCGAVDPRNGDDDDDSAASDDDDSAASDDDDAVSDDDDAASDDDDAADDDDTLPSGPVTCSPGLSALTLTSGITQDVQLSADLDGVPSSGDSWLVVQGPGSVDPSGLFTSSPDVGGEAMVAVFVGQEIGYCIVEMSMEGDQNETGDPGLPNGFANASVSVDDSCAAELLYPLDGSVMPGSFAPPLIQWDAAGHSHHALALSSQWTSITLYTTDNSYMPSFEQWQGLTIYDPGDTVTLSLTSGTWNGSSFVGDVCTSSADTQFDAVDASINGTVIYWEPPITKSISFSAAAAPTNSLVGFQSTLPPPFGCHGCHTVNLANPMLMTYGDGVPGMATMLVNLSNPGTILQEWGASQGDGLVAYGAPGPLGSFVVAGTVMGELKLFDAITGTFVGALTTSKPADMPNWSPDGSKIVYVGCDASASALGADDCSLYTQDWNAATQSFGNETLIAARAAGDTLYYPAFSPDSLWVAYNRAEVWTDSSANTFTSNNNPKAKLMLVAASGGVQMELAAANGPGDMTNSWPRWAPVSGSTGWLAWSTKRDYGHTTSDRAQLWVSEIDFSLAAAGSDGSSPPVWLPGQLTTAGNHTPTWLPRFN